MEAGRKAGGVKGSSISGPPSDRGDCTARQRRQAQNDFGNAGTCFGDHHNSLSGAQRRESKAGRGSPCREVSRAGRKWPKSCRKCTKKVPQTSKLGSDEIQKRLEKSSFNGGVAQLVRAAAS